jgi:hypothetical protein
MVPHRLHSQLNYVYVVTLRGCRCEVIAPDQLQSPGPTSLLGTLGFVPLPKTKAPPDNFSDGAVLVVHSADYPPPGPLWQS